MNSSICSRYEQQIEYKNSFVVECVVRKWQEKRGDIVFNPLTLFTAAIAIPSADDRFAFDSRRGSLEKPPGDPTATPKHQRIKSIIKILTLLS